jgi:hypothetical protein
MNTLITTISLLAVVIGVTGIIPQLATMLRTGSSSSQSMLGWSLGITANLALAFVNAFGYHVPLLAAGNLLSFTGCLIALYLVRRYRKQDAAQPAPSVVTDLHTQEFVALREAVLAEHHRRTGEWQLAV